MRTNVLSQNGDIQVNFVPHDFASVQLVTFIAAPTCTFSNLTPQILSPSEGSVVGRQSDHFLHAGTG